MHHGIQHWAHTYTKKRKRKRTTKQLKHFVDRAIYIFALYGPIMTIPQAVKIWSGQTASGVSITSWGAYILSSSFWLAYGIFHKDKPLIIGNILWLAVETAIIVGVILYR